MNGWIKMHRSMLEWEWYTDTNTKVVFFHLLLSANHEERKWRGLDIGAGQLVTSISGIAEGCGLTAMQVRTALNKLVSTEEITSKTTNKYTILTICKWDSYQNFSDGDNTQNNTQDNKQTTNKQQTNNKQITTNNNNKKDKKERIREVIEGCPDDFRDILEKWIAYRRDTLRKPIKDVGRQLKELIRLSLGDPITANEIVEQSIAKEWQALYELKKQQDYGRQQPTTSAAQRGTLDSFNRATEQLLQSDLFATY